MILILTWISCYSAVTCNQNFWWSVARCAGSWGGQLVLVIYMRYLNIIFQFPAVQVIVLCGSFQIPGYPKFNLYSSLYFGYMLVGPSADSADQSHQTAQGGCKVYADPIRSDPFGTVIWDPLI